MLQSDFWAYRWTCNNAGEFASRMAGQQGEARHYGWNYAWWKGLTKEVRFDLIDRGSPWTTEQWLAEQRSSDEKIFRDRRR